MRSLDKKLYRTLERKLKSFNDKVVPMPGITTQANLHCFICQLIDSIRRVRYIEVIKSRHPSGIYCDASSIFFDPLKAAIWHKNNNNVEEAFWLTFLSTHFGKNRITGWELARGFYGGLEREVYWNWETITADFYAFQMWLAQNQNRLKERGNFGNHRKYQSIDAYKPTGTGSAIRSYIDWVLSYGSHQGIVDSIHSQKLNPREAFQTLYDALDVVSFGRMAKFDFLTMVGKLGLLNIEPGSTYMYGATGPKDGAKLLFLGNKNGNLSDADINDLLGNLETHLQLHFGMQVLEDALCNWQKSPTSYLYFRG